MHKKIIGGPLPRNTAYVYSKLMVILVLSPLAEKMSDEKMVILYEGPVRDLCPLAPNNVNTMACLSIFGIGFDRTFGRLVSDPDTEAHHSKINL